MRASASPKYGTSAESTGMRGDPERLAHEAGRQAGV